MKKLIVIITVVGFALTGCKKEEKPKPQPKSVKHEAQKEEIKKPEIKPEPPKPKVDPSQVKAQKIKSALEKLEADLAAKKKEYGDIKDQRDPYKKSLFMLSRGKISKADAIPDMQKKLLDLHKQLAELKNKGESKKEELTTAKLNINRASGSSGKILRKRRTSDRIGWYYKDAPSYKYNMSELKGRDRKRAIV